MGRYVHLLKPIRDLADNWNVDVARELERYMAEVEELSFEFEGTPGSFNFAEAALLIQGSACVYSRKVEYLYKLVYDTLDLLATKRMAQQQQQSSINDNGEDADVQELMLLDKQAEEEFLSLDDLPHQQDEAALRLKERERTKKEIEALSLKLMPAVLLPNSGDGPSSQLFAANGTAIGHRHDFRMNTSIVHESGALLPGMEDVQLADQTLPAPSRPGSQLLSGVGANSAQQQQQQQQIQGEDGGGGASLAGDFGGDYDDDDDDDNDFGMDTGMDAAPMDGETEAAAAAASKRVTFQTAGGSATPTEKPVWLEEDDPWARVDPHSETDQVTAAAREVPFAKLNSYRLPKSIAILDKQQKQSRSKKPKLAPLSTFFHTVRQRRSRRGTSGRNAMMRLDPAFAAVEHMVVTQDRKRAQRSVQRRKQEQKELEEAWKAAQQTQAGSDTWAPFVGADDDDDDDAFAGDFGGGEDDMDDNDFQMAEHADFAPEAFDDGDRQDGQFAAAAQQQQQQASVEITTTYEQLVRLHVARFVAESQKYVQETELSRRVQEWEDRIRPILEEESRHRPFDIHEYGDELLATFTSSKSRDEARPFADVAGARDTYEVARKFLATLQLANAGNVAIEATGNEEDAEAGNFALKLQTTKRHQDALQGAFLASKSSHLVADDHDEMDD